MNKPLVYVSLFSIFWAFNILASRYVLQRGIHPLTLSAQSLLLTTLMLLVYVFLFRRQVIWRSSRSSTSGAIISGVVGGGLAGIVSAYGLQLSTSINFGFLIKTATAFTVLFAFLFLKEPLSRIKVFYVGIILVGAYLLSTGGKLIVPQVGDIFILLAAVGYAGAAVINRKIIKKDIDPDVVSFFRALMGFLVAGPVAFLVAGSIFSTVLLFPVLLASFFQALLYVYLNKTLAVASASYMTMMSSMVPVIVTIFAMPLFSERLTIVQALGAGLILLGGIATQKTKIAHHL
ncbi:hypothetical protein A2783_05235 [Microgenomates group bacterium RIFCSPHIGHO2_01_FULL_45_11]|nr:MAG: hypothetical protein A2783_05235 [Microgenomates group bacterium RIFCSPHIGHO2_01_FULL_45_11]